MNDFFDWPTSVTRFAPYTLARAEDINATFDLVSYGFDLVAPNASPTFTGDPRSVTPAALNDATTRIPTTAWVQAVLGSMTTVGLPTMSGNAGNVLGTDGTSASWVGVGSLTRAALTGTYAVVAADSSKLLDCDGTFTVTFAAPGTLGAGWQTIIRNSGTGDVTISHTSGNIDGLTSYVLYPGASRLVQCDGSTLRTIPLTGGSRTWTSSGTYIMPPGLRGVAVRCIGAGGGGYGGRFDNTGGVDIDGGYGGGGGECLEGFLTQIASGTSVTVTVPATAAGGASLSANGSSPGSNGGHASFGAYLKAYGGKSNATPGGLPGVVGATYYSGRWYEVSGTSVYAMTEGAGGQGAAGAASNASFRDGRRSLRGGGGGGGGYARGTGAGNGVGSQSAGAGGASGEAAGAASTRNGLGGTAGVGVAGGPGGNPADSFCGSGGGGGGYNNTTTFVGQAGGDGGVPGGGGGGGGAAAAGGFSSGKGGDGGRGEVTVSEVI